MAVPDANTDRVSAAEMVRHFSSIRKRAAQAPVYITHHGRDTHVLCPAHHFHALHDLGGQAEQSILPLDALQLSAWIDQGMILFDQDGMVTHANGALLAMMPHDPNGMIGTPLFTALPELSGSLAEPYVRRAMRHAELALFDMRSPFLPDRWLQCRIAPVGRQIVLLIRDVTRDMDALRQGEQQDELMRAIEASGQVGYVRLTARGYVQSVNDAFAALIGMAERQMIDMHFCRLTEPNARIALSDELEIVLGQGKDRAVRARLLHGEGRLLDVQMGMTCIRSAYGHDGAAVIVSPAVHVQQPTGFTDNMNGHNLRIA